MLCHAGELQVLAVGLPGWCLPELDRAEALLRAPGTERCMLRFASDLGLAGNPCELAGRALILLHEDTHTIQSHTGGMNLP